MTIENNTETNTENNYHLNVATAPIVCVNNSCESEYS